MGNGCVDTFDVCIPTWKSEKVLAKTLDNLYYSIKKSTSELGHLIIVDNNSDDNTIAIARSKEKEYNWNVNIIQVSSSLPEAREIAINSACEDWFLFLDDDVRVDDKYIQNVSQAVAPKIGAIQGRKSSKINGKSDELVSDKPSTNTDWVRKRAFRGGTHATLVRKDAVKNVNFPPDLEVWEDEYLRRHIESQGYLWVFNHQAIFNHENQERHPPGWKSGYLQAKYDLRPFWHVLLNIPYAILTGKSPLGYI